VHIPGEGERANAGVIRLLRGDELAPTLNGWVGMFVARSGGRIVVRAVNPWLPAERAHIDVGDALLSIDGHDLSLLGSRAATFLLRGPVGSTTEVVTESADKTRRTLSLPRVAR